MFLLVALLFPIIIDARFCVDDKKGWCQGHEIWGWCFHNKTSGQFDCDEANFCVGQETLKNKKNAGCFSRDNSTVCCCNDVDGCNLGFIQAPPKYAAGQACYNSLEEPNEDIRLFKPCDDPWCYAFMSADSEGGLTTVQRGCHSRKLVMHNMFLNEDKKYHNNSRWQETEVLASQPTCEDIASTAGPGNGTQKLCYDFVYETADEISKKGRICCCRGSAKCNEKFTWGSQGVTLAELDEIRKSRNQPVGSAHASNMLVGAAISIAAQLLL